MSHDDTDAPTHTLLIVVPLRVRDALPGRAEGLRVEGLGGLKGAAPGLKTAIETLVRLHAPDVAVEGIAAHVVDGDAGSLARLLERAAAEGR